MDQIKQIATDIRAWAEAYALKFDFDTDLNGLCAIASSKLHEVLDRKGYGSSICVWYDRQTNGAHCFLKSKGYIIDITATQFGAEQKVVVIPNHLVNKTKQKYWLAQHELKSVEELIEHQKVHPWIKKSMVSFKKLDWICKQK